MRISDWSSDVCSSDLCCGGVLIVQSLGQIGQTRRFEQVDKIDGQIQFAAQTRDHLHGIQRLAPQGKEIVVATDGAAPQYGLDRKSVVEGKSVYVRVDLCGRVIIQKKKYKT